MLKRHSLAVLFVLGLLTPALSQQPFNVGGTTSVSATSPSNRVALPTTEPVAVVCNTGSVTAYAKFGDSSVTSTATTGAPVVAGACVPLATNGGSHMAGFTASSSATLIVSTGRGEASGLGGGSGGGGGGAVTIADGADSALGATTDAACATDAGNCTAIALIKKGNQNTSAALPAGTNSVGNVGPLAYPIGAVPYTSSATGTTGAVSAGLSGATSVTTYLCGFSIRANATAASTSNATVTGTISGTLNFQHWYAPSASGMGITEMIFAPCVPASGTNTTINVTLPAPGSGGAGSVSVWGYKL
jgi:hypothetical protein